MMRRMFTGLVGMSLLLPELLLAQNQPGRYAASNSPPAAQAQAQAPSTTSQPQSVRPQSRAQRRSYQRETGSRHHSKMTKKEKVFLVAVAGTSMGIGAIAGGGEGLAIGAIVGGWSAYAAHRMWNWIK